MTQQQLDAIITTQAAFLAAQQKAEQLQEAARTAQAAQDAAQKFIDVTLPQQQQQEHADAVTKLIQAQTAKSAAFQAANDAFRARDDAQTAYVNAVRAATQTGNVETLNNPTNV